MVVPRGHRNAVHDQVLILTFICKGIIVQFINFKFLDPMTVIKAIP